MAIRFHHILLLTLALLVASESTAHDEVGLVQKGLAVTKASSNRTAAAANMAMKVSSFIRMVERDLMAARAQEGAATTPKPSRFAPLGKNFAYMANKIEKQFRGDNLMKLFECTRGAGIPGADKVVGLTNGILSMRGNCKEQADGNKRRDCAKDITGFLGDMLGLVMILPQMPTTCFLQDCSAPNNFNVKLAPVIASAAGVETILGMMTAVGNVDAHCISHNTATVAAHEVLQERYPLSLYWSMKPLLLASSAYDTSVMAVQYADEFHYSICSTLAGFAGDTLAMLESMYDVQAHNEAYRAGTLSKSSQWACASGLTKLMSTIPGVIGVACDFSACTEGENVAEAFKEEFQD